MTTFVTDENQPSECMLRIIIAGVWIAQQYHRTVEGAVGTILIMNKNVTSLLHGV